MKKVLAVMMTFAAVSWAQIFVEPPIDFPNTPIKLALETVFGKTGAQYSIEVDLAAAGNVTLTVTEKMELETLLNLILDPKNLSFVKDGAIYKIRKKEVEKGGVPRVTKLYALTYATAGELVRQMKSVLTKEGVVSVDVGTNSLIITDVAEVFEGIETLLKELDNPDRKPKLISVKTKLIESSRSSKTLLGIDFQYTNNGPLSLGSGTLNATGRWLGSMYKSGSYLTGTGGGYMGGAFFGPFTYQDASGFTVMEAEMYATQNSNSIELVANPDVVVEDGTEARVQIGSRVPIRSTTTTGSGATATSVDTFTYQDINMILTVTPQSQRDGTISVQINPQLNQIAGYAYTDIPLIDTREVRTKLFVSNGGTIRLGGMLKDKTTISEQKVPFLGDIPLLGILFKTTQPDTEKIDIQILVSPHVVDYAPPRCKNTPWISQYEVKVPGETDVLVDWKMDLPFGANGVFSYNIYRDVQPITDLSERRPFASGINGDSTSWVDMSRKRRGQTYYYVVTAINPSGMEQAIDPTGKACAVITIPEK